MKHEIIEFEAHLNISEKTFTREFKKGSKDNENETVLLKLIHKVTKLLHQKAMSEDKELHPEEVIQYAEEFIGWKNIPRWEKYVLSSFAGYIAGRVAVTKIGLCRSTLEYDVQCKNLLDQFWNYMLTMRSVKPNTIAKYQYDLINFLNFNFRGDHISFEKLSRRNFTDFIISEKSRCNRSDIITSLRHITNFLSFTGLTDENFKETLPKYKKRNRDNIPKSLPKSEISKILKSVRNQEAGLRNYAIIILMSQLGLRAQEVVAIKLDDIDWQNQLILIRGKNDYFDRMPASEVILSAIFEYIERSRKGHSDYLFVHTKAPYKRFKNGSICNVILKAAYKELNMPGMMGRTGSRVLRHSVAVRLLERDAPLETIRQYLRHRSVSSTQVYARHDIKALRTISPNFPTVLGG